MRLSPIENNTALFGTASQIHQSVSEVSGNARSNSRSLPSSGSETSPRSTEQSAASDQKGQNPASGGSYPAVSESGVSGQQSVEILREIASLKARDTEVRAHERAHMVAGGAYVKGTAHYETEKGPDGQAYAVGGEVSIDTSPVSGDPQATINKMQTVKRAALAPAQPSPQDISVAAYAQSQAALAYQELAILRADRNTETASASASAGRSSLSIVI